MTTNEKFENWYYSGDGVSTTKGLARKAWQAALASLEVTPELSVIASNEFSRRRKRGVTQYESMQSVLAAVFAAIKEGNA